MSAPKTHGAHHLSLTVTDLDRSTAFYTEVVGLTVRLRSSDRVAFHDGVMGLVLLLPGRAVPPSEQRFDEARTGLDHIGFRVASPDDVRRAAEHLDACGVPRSEVKPGRLPNSLLVVFRDPDNIQLEFYYSP